LFVGRLLREIPLLYERLIAAEIEGSSREIDLILVKHRTSRRYRALVERVGRPDLIGDLEVARLVFRQDVLGRGELRFEVIDEQSREYLTRVNVIAFLNVDFQKRLGQIGGDADLTIRHDHAGNLQRRRDGTVSGDDRFYRRWRRRRDGLAG